VADRDVRPLADLGDQVLRHLVAQGVAAHQERHLLGVPGEVEGGLAGGVSGADDGHPASAHGSRLGRGGAVEDAPPDQRLQPFGAQPSPRDAHREDHRSRHHLLSIRGAQHVPVAARLERRRLLGEHHVGAEQPCLLAGAIGEVVAADAPGESGDVSDPRAGAGLASRDLALEDDRLEALRRGVDGRREPGRPGWLFSTAGPRASSEATASAARRRLGE
jgi:hypothetical protein